MTTTYEMPIINNPEDFKIAQASLAADFAVKMLGAQVSTASIGNGYIKSATGNDIANIIFEVVFDSGDTKKFLASAIANTGFLKFVDKPVADLYDFFMEVHNETKHRLFEVIQEAQRLEKEAQKLEQKRKDNEKKMEGMKVSAEKEFNNLLEASNKKVTATDEFYWTLGWLAKHVGTITAKMPDFLESGFIKHFGEVEHTTVDSTKVGPSGFTSQWRLSMEASLVKVKELPATLNQYLNTTGKKLSKTSFIWKLVDDYGFKFGKVQDVVNIMRHVPIEYIPFFNEGYEA